MTFTKEAADDYVNLTLQELGDLILEAGDENSVGLQDVCHTTFNMKRLVLT